MRGVRIPRSGKGSFPPFDGPSCSPKGKRVCKIRTFPLISTIALLDSKGCGAASRHFRVLQPCPHPNKLTGLCARLLCSQRRRHRERPPVFQKVETVDPDHPWLPTVGSGLHLKTKDFPSSLTFEGLSSSQKSTVEIHSQVSRPSGRSRTHVVHRIRARGRACVLKPAHPEQRGRHKSRDEALNHQSLWRGVFYLQLGRIPL